MQHCAESLYILFIYILIVSMVLFILVFILVL